MCQNALLLSYTLKTPGSDLTRKRVRGGQTHFGVRPTRNPCQTDAESESERHFGLRFRSFLPGFQINLTQEFLECMTIAMHFGTFHFTPTPINYSGVLHIPKLRNHNKWHIIVKRNNRAFQWYQMQGKWVGNKREIVSQTWVSELFLRSLFV